MIGMHPRACAVSSIALPISDGMFSIAGVWTRNFRYLEQSVVVVVLLRLDGSWLVMDQALALVHWHIQLR